MRQQYRISCREAAAELQSLGLGLGAGEALTDTAAAE